MPDIAGDHVAHHPKPITEAGHVEPVARRVRGTLGGVTVLDTVRALYLWEWPFYPRFQIPVEDFAAGVLVDEQHEARAKFGTVARFGLRAGGQERPGAARRYVQSDVAGLSDTVRIDWNALDHWFEEDEEVFVHPRNPYVRVDALRSSRSVRVELDGVLLAASDAPVLVFETGLPTRFYFDRTAVDLDRLAASDTVTDCPYKGRTSDYWGLRVDGVLRPDLAWSYAFPTRQLLPIAGLVAFYDEHVDTIVDGTLQQRPVTHFA